MSRRSERGVVLFVALIVLIVMSLAGLALMRQMGAGTSIAGNVAFKEAATAVADVGVEKARIFVQANSVGNTLWNDSAADGYFATWDPAFDPLTSWPATSVTLPTTDGAYVETKNRTSYVIHRLCETAGAPYGPGQRCSEAAIKGPGSRGGIHAATPDLTPQPQPFYRVTARVAGPRNTFSIVQVIMTY